MTNSGPQEEAFQFRLQQHRLSISCAATEHTRKKKACLEAQPNLVTVKKLYMDDSQVRRFG